MSDADGRDGTARAEALLQGTGERLGAFASLALRGIERMAAGARPDTPSPAPSAASPTERAEEVLDHLGGTLGYLAAMAGHRLRVAAALAREEAEDLWAEARHLRQGGDEPE